MSRHEVTRKGWSLFMIYDTFSFDAFRFRLTGAPSSLSAWFGSRGRTTGLLSVRLKLSHVFLRTPTPFTRGITLTEIIKKINATNLRSCIQEISVIEEQDQENLASTDIKK
jgi:hypothetical protein